DTMDVVQPVRILGPPPLPAKATYREAIGSLRAGYGLWVRAHKTVSLDTCWRSSRRGVRGSRWHQTATRSAVSFGAVGNATGAGSVIDPAMACGFWKAILSMLRAAELGTLAQSGHLERGASSGGHSISVQLGNGQEHRLEFISQDLLKWLREIEVSSEIT
ncbi:unnamed protein product, partial [Polarella glacialis]